jgi:hypothetical protein
MFSTIGVDRGLPGLRAVERGAGRRGVAAGAPRRVDGLDVGGPGDVADELDGERHLELGGLAVVRGGDVQRRRPPRAAAPGPARWRAGRPRARSATPAAAPPGPGAPGRRRGAVGRSSTVRAVSRWSPGGEALDPQRAVQHHAVEAAVGGEEQAAQVVGAPRLGVTQAPGGPTRRRGATAGGRRWSTATPPTARRTRRGRLRRRRSAARWSRCGDHSRPPSTTSNTPSVTRAASTGAAKWWVSTPSSASPSTENPWSWSPSATHTVGLAGSSPSAIAPGATTPSTLSPSTCSSDSAPPCQRNTPSEVRTHSDAPSATSPAGSPGSTPGEARVRQQLAEPHHHDAVGERVHLARGVRHVVGQPAGAPRRTARRRRWSSRPDPAGDRQDPRPRGQRAVDRRVEQVLAQRLALDHLHPPHGGPGAVARTRQEQGRDHEAKLARRSRPRDRPAGGGSMSLPLPSTLSSVDGLAAQLDAATHDERVTWVRSLGRREQYALFELCRGRPCRVDEFVAEPGRVVRHYGKNGLPLFSWFEKRFVRLPDGTVGGFNHNDFGWLHPLVSFVTGPGHYVAVDSPEGTGEVWVDYRRIPRGPAPGVPAARRQRVRAARAGVRRHGRRAAPGQPARHHRRLVQGEVPPGHAGAVPRVDRRHVLRDGPRSCCARSLRDAADPAGRGPPGRRGGAPRGGVDRVGGAP